MSKRLRNTDGIVVNVSDDTADRLGPEWVDADAPVEEPKRGPGRPKKSEE